MATKVTSKMFTLDTNDFLVGLGMAVIFPVLLIVKNSIAEGSLTFDWKAIGLASVGGLVSYLILKLFTPAAVVITNESSENLEAVKAGSAKAIIVSG